MKKIFIITSVLLMGVILNMNAQREIYEYNITKIASIIEKASLVGEFSEGFLNICIDGKWGYINYKGEIVSSFEYSYAKPFSCGMAKVEKSDLNQYGFVNINGEFVTNEYLMCADDFHDDLAIVYNGKYGVVNKQGELIVPYQPNIIEDYHDGMALVYVNRSKYGAYNTKGQLVIPAIYYGLRTFNCGLARAQIEIGSGLFYVRKNGTRLQPSLLIDGFDFKDNIASVDTKDGRGYMDTNGRITLFQSLPGWPEQFCNIEDFSEGYAVVSNCFEEPIKKGFMNKLGKIIVPLEYDEAYAFADGMAKVANNGLYGFVNTNGRLVVSCIYDDANDFSDGIGIIKKKGKYGYINKQGKLIGQIDFDEAHPFSSGIAKVERNGKIGFIDKYGCCTLDISNKEVKKNDIQEVKKVQELNSDKKADKKLSNSNDEIPLYWGGDVAMKKYFKNNTRYPAIAKEQGLEGDVYILFRVDLDGTIYNVRIAKSTESIFEKEAIRVIKNMPRWKWKKNPNSRDNQIVIHFSMNGVDASVVR